MPLPLLSPLPIKTPISPRPLPTRIFHLFRVFAIRSQRLSGAESFLVISPLEKSEWLHWAAIWRLSGGADPYIIITNCRLSLPSPLKSLSARKSLGGDDSRGVLGFPINKAGAGKWGIVVCLAALTRSGRRWRRRHYPRPSWLLAMGGEQSVCACQTIRRRNQSKWGSALNVNKSHHSIVSSKWFIPFLTGALTAAGGMATPRPWLVVTQHAPYRPPFVLSINGRTDGAVTQHCACRLIFYRLPR